MRYKEGDRVFIEGAHLDKGVNENWGTVRNVLVGGYGVEVDGPDHEYWFLYEEELSPNQYGEEEEKSGLTETDEGTEMVTNLLDFLDEPQWGMLGNVALGEVHPFKRREQFRIIAEWSEKRHDQGEQACIVHGAVCPDAEQALVALYEEHPEVDKDWKLTLQTREVSTTEWIERPELAPHDIVKKLRSEVEHWKNNHASEKAAKRVLHEKYDALIRAQVVEPLKALGKVDAKVRELWASYGETYADAVEDVRDVIAEVEAEVFPNA